MTISARQKDWRRRAARTGDRPRAPRSYHSSMATAKVALALEEELLAAIRECVGTSEESLSRGLADAANRKLRTIAARAALQDYEQEFGPISQEEIEAVGRMCR